MREVWLPWPPKECSPNARVHWSKRAKAAKQYRELCCIAAKNGRLSVEGIDGRIHLWLDFYPPNRQRRDDDNLMAAFKAGRDGLADALGLDDARFVCHPWLKDEPVKGGKVHARITAGPSTSEG
jgi:crossover junction endodeoxyribonuclease RusA